VELGSAPAIRTAEADGRRRWREGGREGGDEGGEEEGGQSTPVRG